MPPPVCRLHSSCINTKESLPLSENSPAGSLSVYISTKKYATADYCTESPVSGRSRMFTFRSHFGTALQASSPFASTVSAIPLVR